MPTSFLRTLMTPQFWHFKLRTITPGLGVLALSLGGAARCRSADDFITAPPLEMGPIGTTIPFLIKEATQFTTNVPTMRYQQVYNTSLFTNASAGSIYITTLTFAGGGTEPPTVGWTVPSMQINLSTTTNSANNLSSVFAENVGADDTVVLDRTSYNFAASSQLVLLNRPFRFSPPLGSLLLDVRIFDGSGPPFPPNNPFPQMQAYNSPTDEVSRLWSTNVLAATATGGDTVGLYTLIELSPVPSLRAQFFPLYQGNQTNIIVISWPSEPSNFALQVARQLGAHPSWGPATNQIFGLVGPNQGGGKWIEVPAASAGAAAFYRLVWPNGNALNTTVTVPKPTASNINEIAH